jgi:hypothetical protein
MQAITAALHSLQIMHKLISLISSRPSAYIVLSTVLCNNSIQHAHIHTPLTLMNAAPPHSFLMKLKPERANRTAVVFSQTLKHCTESREALQTTSIPNTR